MEIRDVTSHITEKNSVKKEYKIYKQGLLNKNRKPIYYDEKKIHKCANG